MKYKEKDEKEDWVTSTKWHWPGEEARERQADRVTITDHSHHLKHPDVLQLGRHMGAVKSIRLTRGVGSDTLHKVRRAGIQLTDHLWHWVLKEGTIEDNQLNSFNSMSNLLCCYWKHLALESTFYSKHYIDVKFCSFDFWCCLWEKGGSF